MEISLGLVPEKEEYFGLELALNNNTKISKGLEIGGVNVSEESRGVQVGAINAANELNCGAQIGGMNGAGESRGVQIGVANLAIKSNYGVQIGLIYNYSKKLRGAQFSPLLNICGEDSKGFQLGLINWRNGNPWYSKLVPIAAIRTNRKKSIEDNVEVV